MVGAGGLCEERQQFMQMENPKKVWRINQSASRVTQRSVLIAFDNPSQCHT